MKKVLMVIVMVMSSVASFGSNISETHAEKMNRLHMENMIQIDEDRSRWDPLDEIKIFGITRNTSPEEACDILEKELLKVADPDKTIKRLSSSEAYLTNYVDTCSFHYVNRFPNPKFKDKFIEEIDRKPLIQVIWPNEFGMKARHLTKKNIDWITINDELFNATHTSFNEFVGGFKEAYQWARNIEAMRYEPGVIKSSVYNYKYSQTVMVVQYFSGEQKEVTRKYVRITFDKLPEKPTIKKYAKQKPVFK